MLITIKWEVPVCLPEYKINYLVLNRKQISTELQSTSTSFNLPHDHPTHTRVYLSTSAIVL